MSGSCLQKHEHMLCVASMMQVCSRLGLTSLAYMWHQPQRQLLRCAQGCGWRVQSHRPQLLRCVDRRVQIAQPPFFGVTDIKLLPVAPAVCSDMISSGIDAVLVKVRGLQPLQVVYHAGLSRCRHRK
jgi:hypothetical protein